MLLLYVREQLIGLQKKVAPTQNTRYTTGMSALPNHQPYVNSAAFLKFGSAKVAYVCSPYSQEIVNF